MDDDIRSMLDDIAYARDDTPAVGTTKACPNCGTNLKLGIFIRAKMWQEDDIKHMSVAHTRDRCVVIADGGDPDYRPPTPPREPQCKSKRSWVAGDEMQTRYCLERLGHESTLHGGHGNWWTDEQADPAGITQEALWALRAPKPDPDESWPLPWIGFR